MNLNLRFFQQSLPFLNQSDAENIDLLRHLAREHDIIAELILALSGLAPSEKHSDLPQILKAALGKQSELPLIIKTALTTAPFVKTDQEQYERWREAQDALMPKAA